MKRAASGDRGEANTKLANLGILRSIRKREDLFHFGDFNELEINVNNIFPEQVASRIYENMSKTLGYKPFLLEAPGGRLR